MFKHHIMIVRNIEKLYAFSIVSLALLFFKAFSSIVIIVSIGLELIIGRFNNLSDKKGIHVVDFLLFVI